MAGCATAQDIHICSSTLSATISTFLHLIEDKLIYYEKSTLIIFLCILTFNCNSDDDSTIAQNCDIISEIISEVEFNLINTSNYEITEVELKSDCLEITFSFSGCGTELWGENLYSVNAFYAVFPLQRAVRMELINEELCQAVFQKSISFDLTPFKIEGQSEIPLNIDRWNEQITYKQ
ncbi:hypothetical protein [Gelidibacter salicanalis]|uniref:Uncharacterized protein n=1 Tax=Gelidibacter salicanalis TaxID=291193 RepID=A0A934NHD6_9FLAO|nr:hypothetical protein [Gelidibacter salicanalis]MBJ7879598.1 hypothetical protein [Gelidibacter salicanalis]